MASYVKAEQRRAQARAAALRILGRGQVGFDQLALRHVAQEMDVPLSTLTYAYPSTRVLLEDLSQQYNEDLWDGIDANAGGAGLHVELQRAAEWFLVEILRKPASRALMLWQIDALTRAQWSRAEYTSRRAAEFVGIVAARAGEHYRIPHEVLGDVLAAMANGGLIRWMADSDDRLYISTMLAGLDGIALLADPRPLDQPHPEPALLDHGAIPIPGAP